MNTFLPYPNYADSAACLDNKRLFKQVVECKQMIMALNAGPVSCSKCWKCHPKSDLGKICFLCLDGKIRKTPYYNHPACEAWRGYVPSLCTYMLSCVSEWHCRGFDSGHALKEFALNGLVKVELVDPWWIGIPELHQSWRSRLIQKDPVWYGPIFGDEPVVPQIWPTRDFQKSIPTYGKVYGIDLASSPDSMSYTIL